MYPLWLMHASGDAIPEDISGEIDGVTIIYLSRNGAAFVSDKINFLKKELQVFEQSEIIVIDDNSSDGSIGILESFGGDTNISIIFNEKQKGIPNSMNKGVAAAKYNYIVFCDQRQKLSNQAIEKLILALKNRKVGAVSASISHFDQQNRFSFIRAGENFIKSYEAKNGSLIGVYGPLYAIKKEHYSQIPDDIILDDLYLTLKILKSNHVSIIKDCKIIDMHETLLISYERTKRYLRGFFQLLIGKDLIKPLSKKQIVMLFWHKYLRLLIPLLLLIEYISLGVKSLTSWEYFIAFIIMSIVGLISMLLQKAKISFFLQNFVQINIYYAMAFFDLLFIDFLYNKIRLNSANK